MRRGWFRQRAPRDVRSEEHFTPAQCATFFAQVLVNDRVAADAALPAAIRLEYTPEVLTRCYAIARQVWGEVDRRRFCRLAKRLAWCGTLDAEDQLEFKHARAKFKQLRFAYASCDRRHRYPRLFHFVTAVMGHLQDDFKNGRTSVVRLRAILLRLLLGRIGYAALQWETRAIVPGETAEFRAYCLGLMRRIQADIAIPIMTAKAFHDIRKIISRNSAFYVAVTTLYPSDESRTLFRYFSTINGLMGAMHDELVARAITGKQDYHADPFGLPDDIRQRLTAITRRFLAQG